MSNEWTPGTQYHPGDVVFYQADGHYYKNIQGHVAQNDWPPSNTAALWGRVPDHERPQQRPYDSEKHNYIPPTQGGLPSGEGVNVHHEERKKHWNDLDDHRKKQLEVGGGLLGGAALLAAGYAAYKSHEKNEEEKKAQTWGLQNWVHAAEARTQDYRNGAPIVVGREKDWTLYICRAFYDGGLQLGKASPAFQKGAVIGYKGEEVQLPTYELLVGDMNGLRWVNTHGRLNVASLEYQPVEGGEENDGTPLYIAKAHHRSADHPGKASPKLDGAYIPYDGGEECVKSYSVLCYNQRQ
ncbi:carbohydrate-binding module family 12 protein [Mycena olivaceomarginata]|nr:carbohydrate-binding module family 12 protein [Mycena olivaceomarginata]